jgi:hypothetical protein
VRTNPPSTGGGIRVRVLFVAQLAEQVLRLLQVIEIALK